MNRLGPRYTFEKGDLVRVFKRRSNTSAVGVIVQEIHDAAVDGFSRYAVLIEDRVVTCRKDMIQKEKESST